MLVIFSANFAKCTQTVKEEGTVEPLVSEGWLSWSSFLRFGLALQVNLSRNLKPTFPWNYQLSDQVQYSIMASRTSKQVWSKGIDVGNGKVFPFQA